MKGWEWWHTVAAIACVLWILSKLTTARRTAAVNALLLVGR